jgi:uncharacterized protein DUF4136
VTPKPNGQGKEKSMKSIFLVLIGAMTACGTATSSGPHVQSEGSASAALASYRTFGFRLAERPAAPFEVSARGFEVERRMRPLIVAELSRKGYIEQAGEGKPDFVIAFACGYTKEAAGQTELGGSASTRPTERGGIVIDAFDTSSDTQVWHGAAESKVDPEHIDDALLQAAVQRLLAPFPARRAGFGPVAAAQAP